ncbi:MAG: lysophospholipid acyltransferase family protein [Dongiaceae bacterium]
MVLLRSLAFNLLFGAWTGFLAVVGTPLLLLPAGATWALGRLWIGGGLALLSAIVGLRHRVIGLEHLPVGSAIYAAKHQSAWDTLVLSVTLDRPAFVLKQELLGVPFFGWYLRRCGMIAVDRQGRAAALKRMLTAAQRAAAAGRPILIFPEGTRVSPGERRPYQPGIAALYTHLELPVVPVALNSGLFWGRRSFRKQSGTITLEFLPAMPAGLPRKGFVKELEDRIESATARLATPDVRG